MYQEESNLSDLANCCEYLTSEKLCLAVSDSEKAKAARQVRCKNDEKTTCCYLCMFVLDCATPCRFLERSENVSSTFGVEKSEAENTFINENHTEEKQTEYAPIPFCSLCNVKMSQTRTKFRIDGWKGSDPKLVGNNLDKLGEEILPAIVCLCPKCGKIELRADENLDKN